MTGIFIRTVGAALVGYEAFHAHGPRPVVLAAGAMLIAAGQTVEVAMTREPPARLIPHRDLREAYPPADDYGVRS